MIIKIKDDTYVSEEEFLEVPLTKILTCNISDLPDKIQLIILNTDITETVHIMRMGYNLLMSIEESFILSKLSSDKPIREIYLKEYLFLTRKQFPGFIHKFAIDDHLVVNYGFDFAGLSLKEIIDIVFNFFSWLKATVDLANQDPEKFAQDFLGIKNISQQGINLN